MDLGVCCRRTVGRLRPCLAVSLLYSRKEGEQAMLPKLHQTRRLPTSAEETDASTQQLALVAATGPDKTKGDLINVTAVRVSVFPLPLHSLSDALRADGEIIGNGLEQIV